MQRKFLVNLLLMLSINLMIKPFWIFFIDRKVQNIVGSEAYGLYFAVLNFSFLFTILLDLGITNYNSRNISQNNQLLNKHFSSIVILRLILALLYMAIAFTVGYFVGYDTIHFKMLTFLTLNQFILTFILYLRSNIAGLQLFKTDSLVSVLDRTVMIIICSILLWGHVTKTKFQIEWFVYAQTGGYLFTLIVAFFIVVRKAKFKKLNWNRPFFIMIIKQSFPFALLSLLMMFYNRIDSVMLERLLINGAMQAGIYASAFRLLDAINNFSLLFTFLLLPMFSKMIKHKESIDELVKLAITFLLIPSVIFAVSSFFYGKEIMTLLYPQTKNIESLSDYSLRLNESIVVFSILMWCLIAVSVTYLFGTLLTANGSMKQLNLTAACGVVINVLLNIILIPRFQAVGSAWASLITQAVTAAAQLFLSIKLFRFKINYRFLILLFLFLSVVILLNVFAKHLFHRWGISYLFMISVSVLFAFVIKLIDLKSLYKLVVIKE